MVKPLFDHHEFAKHFMQTNIWDGKEAGTVIAEAHRESGFRVFRMTVNFWDFDRMMMIRGKRYRRRKKCRCDIRIKTVKPVKWQGKVTTYRVCGPWSSFVLRPNLQAAIAAGQLKMEARGLVE